MALNDLGYPATWHIGDGGDRLHGGGMNVQRTLEFLFREVPHFFLFAKMIQSQTGWLALEVSEEDVQIIMEEVNICN